MTANQKAKADGGKTHPILLQKDMAPALYLIQRVLDYGCEKYERRAWHKVDTERWDDAQRRHQQQIDLGEQFDDESGLPHRAHQIAGLIIMFMHELGVTVTVEEVMQLAKYKDPPQDHKQGHPPAVNAVPPQDSWAVVAPQAESAGSKAKWVAAKMAKVGDHVCSKATAKTSTGAVLLKAGARYKIRAIETGVVLIEDERDLRAWYSKERFL